jgi:STE24 endopeptidase
LQEFVLRKFASYAVLCLFLIGIAGLAAKSARACAFTSRFQAPTTAPSDAPAVDNPNGQAAVHATAYTLPPDKYAQARGLARIGYVAGILIPLYSILVLYLMLRWGWSAKFRDWAEARTSQPFYQAGIYCTGFFSVYTLSRLPIRAWFHWLYVKNDLVVQGWASWLADSGKQLMITIFVGTILVTALFSTVRRSPRRWWIQFWLGMLPFIVLIIFLTPLVIDPLFNKFEPLSAHDPQLVNDLERVVNRGGLEIPPQRMFLMKASAKVNLVNAYVTGLGASKRVVVWDTTIAKMTRPEILFVFGHEMGHYVLNHVYKGMAVTALGLLAGVILIAWITRWWIERPSTAGKIRGSGDLATLPIYAIPFLFLSFVATPISNVYSRYVEHQADQYGLEVTHGLTPDSGQVAADSFQILGEIDLEDPSPTRLEILWYWDHPWIGDRIQYALHYDPWAKGEWGEFVK